MDRHTHQAKGIPSETVTGPVTVTDLTDISEERKLGSVTVTVPVTVSLGMPLA